MEAQVTDEQWEAIEAELFAGRKIGAIKLFREATRCGLADAKAAMDEHAEKLRESSPESFASTRGGGCTGMLLIMVGMATASVMVLSALT